LRYLSASDQKKINLKTVINDTYANVVKVSGFYKKIEKEYGR
jgi:hypothetical protein